MRLKLLQDLQLFRDLLCWCGWILLLLFVPSFLILRLLLLLLLILFLSFILIWSLF